MRLDRAAIAPILDLMQRTGAEELMPRFHNREPNRVREKTSAFDVVSEADEAAEVRLSTGLATLFPGAALVGEETAGNDPRAIAALDTAELGFLIDPIDGTKNFTSGLPLFGMMIAGVSRGEVVFGAIHDPVCAETSVALRGEGAWLLRADGSETALQVAAPCPPDRMHVVAGTNFLPPDLRPAVQENLPRFGMNFWMRCAAQEYRLAAAGHCELLVYNRLMPWDHAAGWLLHREAGGHAAHFDGSEYRPTHTTGGLICAPDRDSWIAARDCLFGRPG